MTPQTQAPLPTGTDPEVTAVDGAVLPSAAPSRFARWRGPLLSFLVGQPAVQFLNLITGFFLLRWLDINEFAMFGIAFAFQSTVSQLTDLGFSGSIVALSGSRGHDPEVLGGYLRSARYWRTRMQTMTLIVAAIAFPLMTWNQPWSPLIKALLFVSIALGVLFQGWLMYGAALFVNSALISYYRPQIVAALLRLALCALLHAFGLLPAWAAALLGVLSLGFVGASFRHTSRSYIHEPIEASPEKNARMLKYLGPMVPGVAFAAVQGQILIGIIAIFGSTRNIAEISALGRIAQLFLILGAFNMVFIEPYIARVSRDLLLRRYLQILTVATLISAAIAVVGFVYPQPLLWLLGSNYSGLQREIGWVVLTASTTYLGGVVCIMHAARRWVFWWATGAIIGAVILTQIICAMYLDMTQPIQVIWLGFITSIVTLLVHVAAGIYGFTAHKSSDPD